MNPEQQPEQASTGKFPAILSRETTDFTANGIKYVVDKNAGLSVARDRALEKLTIYSLLGRQPGDIIKALKEAYASVNAGKLADAAVKLDNLLVGAMDMENKAGPLWYVCTLFINREDEDRTQYNFADAEKKIKDWEIEGLDRDFFMGAGLVYLTTTAADFATLTQNYSELGITNRPNLSLSDS